jgi:hypothetical protein
LRYTYFSDSGIVPTLQPKDKKIFWDGEEEISPTHHLEAKRVSLRSTSTGWKPRETEGVELLRAY